MKKSDKKITIVGGPFAQHIDPVLRLVPTGHGKLAARLAGELEKRFEKVCRIGNFSGGTPCVFDELWKKMESLETNVLVFLPHLPNIIVNPSLAKIRLEEGEYGMISYSRAPKIVENIKKWHPEVLLVPFKLADPLIDHLEVKLGVVRWMLGLHSALAVYSILGESGRYYIIDALANETLVSKQELPEVLAETIVNFSKATRRRSERVGETVPKIRCLNDLVWFSREMRPAFRTIIGGNVLKERWPGNFSFRCTHGFLSARAEEGFVVTIRNVAKENLAEDDFVFVSLRLKDGKLQWSGKEGVKPSIDSPVHRIIYEKLPWVKCIVHGHLRAQGDCVYARSLQRWPCGAENEGEDIVAVVPPEKQKLWVVNVEGHGFVALIGDDNSREALEELSRLEYFSNC